MYAAVLTIKRSSVFKKAGKHVVLPLNNAEIFVRERPVEKAKASEK